VHPVRSIARVALVMWMVLSFVGAGVSFFSGNAAAQTVEADSVGEVSVYGFVAWYAFVLSADDCINVRLVLNGVAESSLDYGCGVTGQAAFDGLAAPLDTGRYTLEIASTTTNALLYTRSWDTPAIEMTTAVSPTSPGPGDSVVVSAVFRLLPGGPDAYSIRGTLSVDAGSAQTQDISIVLLSARDLDFWTGTPSSAYESFTATWPLTFGTAGSRSVAIEYVDELHVLAESRTIAVTQLAASGTGDSTATLVLASIALGLAGLAVGGIGLLTARRALRAVPRYGVSAPAPVPMMAFAPAALPPAPPPPPPAFVPPAAAEPLPTGPPPPPEPGPPPPESGPPPDPTAEP